MHIDSSGNVGIGVTPNDWGPTITALQIDAVSISAFLNNVMLISGNAYYDDTANAYKYINDGFASQLTVNNSGNFEFKTAGSGTTGNTDTSPTPSFAISIGDTNLYLLELTIIDNSGMSWICLYPTLVYFDGGSWIALRTSQPGTTGIDNLGQTISNRKLLKIVDIMGRETEFKRNEVLFYMYDDGSTEKKFFK